MFLWNLLIKAMESPMSSKKLTYSGADKTICNRSIIIQVNTDE